MTTPTTASISGSSYAISCPAALNPPIKEYLFADDHPAVNTPMVPKELIASAKKTPNSKSATTNVGLNGTTANKATQETITYAGAHLNTGLSTSVGIMSSF